MPTHASSAITFYPVALKADRATATRAATALRLDLSQRTYTPIKNPNFQWQVPALHMDTAALHKKPKMDIAVAMAVDNPRPAASAAIDNQHLLTDASHPTNTVTKKMPLHAAKNNPVSFKTVENPDATEDLSALSQQELAAAGVLYIDLPTPDTPAAPSATPFPDYEAIPETLSEPLPETLPETLSETLPKDDAPSFAIDNPASGLHPKQSLANEAHKTHKVHAAGIKLDTAPDAAIAGEDINELDPEELALLEEEKRKEKEAKLEAYKQFVAEQESKIEIDYQGIRVSIEANALPSRTYFTMNALSAIIASYGLVVNSAAVVIGAMLVAMMLGPISGVALATIDYRMPLLRKSLLTVLAGGTMVVAVGFIVGWIHADLPLSNEILSRTQPTSMDLMIALAGGTAGAYAMISPNLSVAVVGVAVATALVPPLAASGILFSHGEAGLGFGALLLAITNIIAIQLTNAMVLWFAGFRRLMVDDYKTHPFIAFCRRNAVPLVLLVAIGGYLSYNFNVISKRQNFESEVKETINDYFIEKGNSLTASQFVVKKDYQMIRAVIRGETRPTSIDAKHIENVISQYRAEKYPDYLPVRIQLRYMPVVVIDSSPDFNGSIDKTDAAILSTDEAN